MDLTGALLSRLHVGEANNICKSTSEDPRELHSLASSVRMTSLAYLQSCLDIEPLFAYCEVFGLGHLRIDLLKAAILNGVLISFSGFCCFFCSSLRF